jgi:hypothetical protein
MPMLCVPQSFLHITYNINYQMMVNPVIYLFTCPVTFNPMSGCGINIIIIIIIIMSVLYVYVHAEHGHTRT